MKISKNWLSDYLELDDISGEQFEDLITTKVAEVDEVYLAAAPVADAVPCEITVIEDHPEKASLKIATIVTAAGEHKVVCGAPNCRTGLKTAYVAPGGSVVAPSGERTSLSVERKDIAGVISEGILVSEAELDLTGDHSGVIELDAELDIAKTKTLAEILGGPDTILEIDNKSLTHRPDLWSHFGFARELSAILGRPLKMNPDEFADDDDAGRKRLDELGSGKANFKIKVEKASECRRFSAIEIDNVSTQESPLWIRRRLSSVDAGVRNILVDLSNYVMLDIGQPNHTYDADCLQGDTVFVRLAKDGEKFLGLDDVERELTKADVVIADNASAVALGGVIGGGPSSVSEKTKRVLLESANFHPVQVRKTAHQQQVRTDASNRFEKSRSAYSVPLALHRYIELLREVEPNLEVVGSVTEDFPLAPESISVSLDYAFIRTRLGAEVSDEEIETILTGLGFGCGKAGSDGVRDIAVPYYRATRDISIAEDLVEEIGRIYGYERVPEAVPLIGSEAPRRDALRLFKHKIRDALVGNGFCEASNYSFFKDEFAKRAGYDVDSAILLANPISAEEAHLRTSLVPGMLDFVVRNGRYQSSISLFELGRGYHPDRDKPDNQPASESQLLSVAYRPEDEAEKGSKLSTPEVDAGGSFYAVCSLLRQIVALVSKAPVSIAAFDQAASNGGPPQVDANSAFCLRRWMHPFRQGAISVGGTVIGVVAEVHPAVDADMPARTVVAEIDLNTILNESKADIAFTPIPKFPDSFFEVSVVMPNRKPYVHLHDLLCSCADAELLRSIEVLSVYEGEPLAAGKKSISCKLSFGAPDRTLSGEELKGLQDKVIAGIASSEFSLRG